MNVILTYQKTEEFNDSSQKSINKIQFVQIPEMRVLDNATPYQANVTEDEFNTLKSMLEAFGEVCVVGKWNDDGFKIECDATKYKTLLKDIEVFEDAVFYDGVDYTGIEDTYIYENIDGVDIIPNVNSFVRVKESKRPTLAQSKKIQVNTFNNEFIREL